MRGLRGAGQMGRWSARVLVRGGSGAVSASLLPLTALRLIIDQEQFRDN